MNTQEEEHVIFVVLKMIKAHYMSLLPRIVNKLSDFIENQIGLSETMTFMVFLNNSFKKTFLAQLELTPPWENSGWSPLGVDTLFLLFLHWKPEKLSYSNHEDT